MLNNVTAMPQIFVRIFSLKGLSADVMRKHPNSRISIASELLSIRSETHPQAIGGKIKANEVTWSDGLGLLKWDASLDSIQHIKSIQPKLKLQIVVHDDNGSTTLNSFVLLDTRDLTREIKNQSFNIHGMNGATLTLSAKLNSSPRMTPQQPVISNPILDLMGISTESFGSVLRPEGKTSPTGINPEFSISISLEDFKDITNISLQQSQEDDEINAISKSAVYPIQPNRTFWLCWTLFDQTFSSEEFAASHNGPRSFRDTIRIQLSMATMIETLHNVFPLKIFLCTQNKVLAYAELSIKDLLDTNEFPFIKTDWLDFISMSDNIILNKENAAAIKVGVNISKTIDISIKTNNNNENEVEIDDNSAYSECDFEDDEDDNTPPPPAPNDSHKDIKEVHFQDDNKSNKLTNSSNNPSNNQDNTSSEDDEDEEKQQQLRHFRLSIEVKSIGGFKRPAHLAIQFSYPHLGAGVPVRTHPLWVLANTEVKVDNASATYECCLSRDSLYNTLSSHLLKIAAVSRSHLGYTAVGDVSIDMSSITKTKPHSVRCPITGKSFKTKKDYIRHRQVMSALKAAGKISRAPPVEPILIKAVDLYLGITAAGDIIDASGGKMRVLVVIEDLGMVGNEIGLNVRPGYSQQGGGVYSSIDHDRDYPDIDDDGLAITSNTHAEDPLDRTDLTNTQRSHLEALRVDWEGWRRAAEAQWKEALREKEIQLRKKLEQEASASLSERADDLRRGHEEAGRLEVRLRAGIDAVEKQKMQWNIREEESSLKLAQKTSELQLLQRRIKDEAKILVENEKRRCDNLTHQIANLQSSLLIMEKRAKDAEKDFELFRQKSRNLPENTLREEIAKKSAQLSESRGEIERERRLRSETELEKEHFRSQMHRLAIALKREREKSAVIARQELEQLRLEFLAREERYVLDGDREELRNIRHELSNLRSLTLTSSSPSYQSISINNTQQPPLSPTKVPNSETSHISPPKHMKSNLTTSEKLVTLRSQLDNLLLTGFYTANDPLVSELQKNIKIAESNE